MDGWVGVYVIKIEEYSAVYLDHMAVFKALSVLLTCTS